jgi:hypothetical protein
MDELFVIYLDGQRTNYEQLGACSWKWKEKPIYETERAAKRAITEYTKKKPELKNRISIVRYLPI